MTVKVTPGNSINAAIRDGARCIQLYDGTYIETVELPPDRPITISGVLGTRLGGNGNQPAIRGMGARGATIADLRLLPTRDGISNVVHIEGGTDIQFRRLTFHGGSEGQRRVILGNGRNIHVVDCEFLNVFRRDDESNAFCAYDGAGPYVLDRNYFEVAGINVLFGGADSQSPEHVPSDIHLSFNVLTKRQDWRPEGANPAVVKTLLELKAARRATIEHNVLEHCWTHGHIGFAVVLTPRNDSGLAPWTEVRDVTIRHNWIRYVERGFNLLGHEYQHPSGQLTDVVISDNTIECADRVLMAGGEVGTLELTRNRATNGGFAMLLYGGASWPVSEGLTEARPARFAIDRLLYHSNQFANETIFGDGNGINQAALDHYVRLVHRSETW